MLLLVANRHRGFYGRYRTSERRRAAQTTGDHVGRRPCGASRRPRPDDFSPCFHCALIGKNGWKADFPVSVRRR